MLHGRSFLYLWMAANSQEIMCLLFERLNFLNDNKVNNSMCNFCKPFIYKTNKIKYKMA